MNCANCNHPKNRHDSDADERNEKEWCNVRGCKCGRFVKKVRRPTQRAADWLYRLQNRIRLAPLTQIVRLLGGSYEGI